MFFFLFFVILVSLIISDTNLIISDTNLIISDTNLIIRDTNITKNIHKNTRKVMYYNTVQSQFNATYKISLVNNECREHNIKYHGAEAQREGTDWLSELSANQR